MWNELFQQQFHPLFTLHCFLRDPVSPLLHLCVCTACCRATGTAIPVLLVCQTLLTQLQELAFSDINSSNQLGDKGEELDIVHCQSQ